VLILISYFETKSNTIRAKWVFPHDFEKNWWSFLKSRLLLLSFRILGEGAKSFSVISKNNSKAQFHAF